LFDSNNSVINDIGLYFRNAILIVEKSGFLLTTLIRMFSKTVAKVTE